MKFRGRLVLRSILAGLALCLVLVPSSAYADDPVESITLSPTSKTYHVNPGQTLQDTLTVLNDGQTPYTFTVYATPYSVASANYDDPNFSATKPNADAYTWIQFDTTTYRIEPRQTIKVPYTVKVKTNASPGGHYGAIFAEVQPDGTTNQQLARKKRVGSIIYATVSGDVKLAGNVVNTDTPWFQSIAPITSNISVKNTGNSDFAATIDYRVSDIFGNTKYNSQNDYEVLPSTSRNINPEWVGANWLGIYNVHVATTVLGKTISNNTIVLIAPVWLLLVLVVVVLTGIYYAFGKRRKTTSR